MLRDAIERSATDIAERDSFDTADRKARCASRTHRRLHRPLLVVTLPIVVMDPPNHRRPRFAGIRRAPVWPLIVVTLSIICLFVTSTLYSKRTAARLDSDAASVATNASPSIAALSAARGALFRAEVAVARAIETANGSDTAERSAAEDAIRQIRALETEYLSLPFFPGERDHWKEVDVATHAFEEEVTISFAAIAAGRLDEARAILTTQLRPATEGLDKGLEFLVSFNAAQQRRLGMEIPRLRHHAARINYLLEAASALLAILLLALVVRESRRRQRLLAHFSDRLEEIVAATARITAALARHDNQRPVLNAIVTEACRLVDADYAALGFMVDRNRPFDSFVFHGFSAAEVEATGRFPRPVGILGQVIADGQPLRVDDVTKHPSFRGWPAGHPPMGAFLGVPVRRDGHGSGNLYLARRPGRAPFTGEDEHIIQLLAAQAAASAENAALYHALEKQRTRAQLLADASERMIGSLAYETTLERAANAVLPGFADVCVLHLSDDSGAITRMVMAATDPVWRILCNELTARYAQPTERHPALHALRERRSLSFAVDEETLAHMAQDEEHRSLLQQFPMKHGLSVPLVGGARLLGVISFYTFSEAGFGEDDVAFAEELTHRAALAIDNALLHDRTERAVQARADLLAIVSHDLRNPLGAIRMATGLLKREPAAVEEKRHELADRIGRTTERMMRLIEDLLAASKIESGSFSVEPKPEPVAAMIDEAVDSFRDSAATKSIALHEELDGVAAEVMCDRDRVLQVLSNLIGNALKFTPPDGAITVSVRSLGAEVRVSVADTGAGIPEAEREHVFDRYWQATHTRRAGAGLGLFIVKGIVEAHGGRAWAEAGPGGGACLCFTLPTYSSSLPIQQPDART